MKREDSWARLQMAMMLAFGGRAPCALPKRVPENFHKNDQVWEIGLGTKQGLEIVIRFMRDGERWMQSPYTNTPGPAMKLAVPRVENKEGRVVRRPREEWYYADDLQKAAELAGLAAVERSDIVAKLELAKQRQAA